MTSPSQPEPRSDRNGRDLRLVVGAVGLSALGDTLAYIPLMLHLQEETGSGLAVAALLIAFWGPMAVLAGPAGLLVDRTEARRLLLRVSLVQIILGAALAVIYTESVAAIYVLATLLGTGLAVTQPAEFALLPNVAGAERIQAANGYVEAARYIGFTAGPLLGAGLAAAGLTRLALVLNAASFAAVALAALLLRARRPPAPSSAGQPQLAREGIVLLFADKLLAIVLATAFLTLLFFTASSPAEVFFAVDFLDAGELGYGLLLTSWTLGMGFGATALAQRVPKRLLAPVALAAILVQGLGLATPTLHLALWLALAAFMIGGSAHGLKNVIVRTMIHERVPERVHGRAFAAYNGIRNSAELGALAAGGVLIALLDARWTLFLSGAIPVLIALVALTLHRARPEPAAATAA